MFDNKLPDVEDLRKGDDAGLIEVMVGAARLQAAWLARVFAVAAEVYRRRMAEQDAEDREIWAIDGWAAVAAEIAAAQGISQGRAAGQLRIGLALAERLPKFAGLFAAGVVDYQAVAAVVQRTELMLDPGAIPRMDDWLVRNAARWGKWSRQRISEVVDYWVQRLEPAAVRQARDVDAGRQINVRAHHSGLAEIWGDVRAPAALVFDRRLEELAATVCAADPRTKEQRRADALAALAGRATVMACECGSPDCPAAGGQATLGAVVIHVLAEQATVDGSAPTPGFVPGFGGLAAEAVRQVARSAKRRVVRHPGDGPPESGYRPSAALADFVRCRDLVCRFPGCGRLAECADIDHTVPWPWGPTHASNLKLLCRFHHLLKTFYIGARGWGDRQEPDGTVVWTSPTGHRYVTKPGGSLLFPQLAQPTGELVLAPRVVPPGEHRGLMMPTRDRIRSPQRACRIRWERGLNLPRIAAAEAAAAAAEVAAAAAAAADPPPF